MLPPTRKFWQKWRTLGALLVLSLLHPPYSGAGEPAPVWQRGPWQDPNYFPLAVWLQKPKLAGDYQEIGINLYVGLWNGPTAKQLAELDRHGMPVICRQNAYARKNLHNRRIVGWMHEDEPDNARKFHSYWGGDAERVARAWPEYGVRKWKDYGPPLPPQQIIDDYHQIRANDMTRPVFLNFGQGIVWPGYKGRGIRTGKTSDYPRYIEGCDIVSFDVYPASHRHPDVAGKLEFVPRGVEQLRSWTKDNKPVWCCIETTHINNIHSKPTSSQVRSEVWMALIHGAKGLIYFVHEFAPRENDAALLADEKMKMAVRAINEQIQSLAPVLNSPTIKDAVSVSTDQGQVTTMVKQFEGRRYLFAVAMQPVPSQATMHIAGLGDGAVTVLGENRTCPVVEGRFTDHFAPYAVHLYQIVD